jgi:hypothetical protein
MVGVRRTMGVLAGCVVVVDLRHRSFRGLLIYIP